eukprot:2856618-Amphidinium_carterae.1
MNCYLASVGDVLEGKGIILHMSAAEFEANGYELTLLTRSTPIFRGRFGIQPYCTQWQFKSDLTLYVITDVLPGVYPAAPVGPGGTRLGVAPAAAVP